jgi:protein-S-isoprenylcysteine O-methyltransferase Ste14
MQTDKAIDIALSSIALYASIKGTTPPFKAAQEDRGKASNDWIRKLGITRIPVVYHLALTGVTIWQSYRIAIATSSWQSEGAHNMFRFMTIVNILGGALRVLCFRTLGRFFTFDLAVKPDQKVIQTGPYAYVRHPSYTAMLLHQAGFTFTLLYGPLVPLHWRQNATWINSALTLLAAVSAFHDTALAQQLFSPSLCLQSLINLRIRDEEKMLLAELGDQYKAYKRKVPSKIVPFVF